MLDPGEYWVALRADGERGTGKIDDPFDASSPALFSSVMENFGTRTTIHLGPGIFQTFGYNFLYASDGWQVKSGQRIIGAGMNATTLKVVGARPSPGLTSAILHDANLFLA